MSQQDSIGYPGTVFFYFTGNSNKVKILRIYKKKKEFLLFKKFFLAIPKTMVYSEGVVCRIFYGIVYAVYKNRKGNTLKRERIQ